MAEIIHTTNHLEAIKRGLSEIQLQAYDTARLLKTAQDMAEGFGRTADPESFEKIHTLYAILKAAGAMFDGLAGRLDEIDNEASWATC
ncbi:MAG: hypothetical protein CMJ42_08235 [Phyllobacteriaceae bacterium]|nr:hypothetical protein [Phyllobacteriaceae bacterium]MBA89755.1 hypothetical protein [Phyllobacteriaceae bacterium]